MTLLVVGANHHSAPTAKLETLAALDADVLSVEATMSSNVAEAMVISTCNRVEIYAEVDRFHAAVDDLVAQLAKLSDLPTGDLRNICYVHYDERAVQHLFEVAAGLDSMVVGEAQILGQVRGALVAAQDLGTAGRELNEVGQVALRVGKDVRSHTGIDRAGANVVSVGFTAALEELERLSGRRSGDTTVAIIGAGSLSGLAVAHAARLGVAAVSVASRTQSSAERLADTYAATGVSLADLPTLLAGADVVVSCTAAQEILVTAEQVRTAMTDRPDRPLVVLDLALPHDTEPEIAALAGVVRIDLAGLADRPETHADRADLLAAQGVVSSELGRYVANRAARAVEPVLVSLRARGSAVVELELQRLRDRLPGLTADEWDLIEQGLRRTVNTLMHTPTIRMKELAADPDGRMYAQALNSLFDLSTELVDRVVSPREPDGGVST